ncbi:thioredoxin [Sulfurimonas sp. HSL-1716]|uniref:thioredoxin n=1 Tax=Hydrocurvibacter sulfurireducens TaxID=3131937 RepID=UPI0031F8263A
MATIELTQENFDKTVTQNDIVIIDFWAPWCGPCKSFGPVFEKVSEQYPDIVFAKVNTEEEQGLAGHFQIRSIPTTMILKEQVLVFNQAGALPEEGLKDLMEQVKVLDMDHVREEIKKQQESAQQ